MEGVWKAQQPDYPSDTRLTVSRREWQSVYGIIEGSWPRRRDGVDEPGLPRQTRVRLGMVLLPFHDLLTDGTLHVNCGHYRRRFLRHQCYNSCPRTARSYIKSSSREWLFATKLISNERPTDRELDISSCCVSPLNADAIKADRIRWCMDVPPPHVEPVIARSRTAYERVRNFEWIAGGDSHGCVLRVCGGKGDRGSCFSSGERGFEVRDGPNGF